MDSGESGSEQKLMASSEILQEFAKTLRIGAGKRFGPGTEDQISARVLDFFKIAPGSSPGRETFEKWWNAETLPPWQQAVQLAILLDDYGDWLIFPDRNLPPQPSLARAFFLASAKTRKVPSNTNILSWIHEQIKLQGKAVTRMSLANWVSGQTTPNPKYRPILEDLLGMRRGDLENPDGYLLRIDPKRFKPVRAVKEKAAITTSLTPPAPQPVRAAPVVKKRIRNRPAPPSTSAIGAILEKALAALPGISEDPKRQRSFLQKELMNRYILDIGLTQVSRWLNGYELPEPEHLTAVCELLRIENLAEQDIYKVALREAVRPIATVSKPQAGRVAGVAAAQAKQAAADSEIAVKAAPKPRKRSTTKPKSVSVQRGKGPVAILIRKQMQAMPDFPRKGADQVKFLKARLKVKNDMRVSIVDIRKWLKGAVIPGDEILAAIAEIMQVKPEPEAPPSKVKVRRASARPAQPVATSVAKPEEASEPTDSSYAARRIKKDWLKIAGMIKESLDRVPGLPKDAKPRVQLLARVRFLKTELKSRYEIRVKTIDVEEWLEGTFAPNGRTLAALSEILGTPELAGMLGETKAAEA